MKVLVSQTFPYPRDVASREASIAHPLHLIPQSAEPQGRVSPYAWAYEHVLFPAWQKLVHGRTIFDHLAQLERSQWLDRETLEAQQLDSLRTILLHAGSSVPYYRELFSSLRFDPRAIESTADLAALPVLTRDIIHERYDDLIDPAHRGTNIKKGTSGTTGRPLQFEYCNESETFRQAVRLRGYRWAGYRLGLPTLHYWAQGAAIPSGLNAAKVKLDRGLRREVYVDAAQQDELSLRRAAETVRRVKPHVIIGYTQATAIFASYIADKGLRDWDDIPVICGAEALLPHDRAAISRAFGPQVFETYGSRETMLVSAECHAHDGMHLSEENLVVEITRDGKPLGAGESGDVVVTDLHNFGMPMIRYLNGDVATLSPDRPCRCGRSLRKIDHVDGRRSDTLRDRQGAPVPGMLFIALFAGSRDLVSQFQVVQKVSGEVTLKVVRGREWDAGIFDATVRRFRRYLRGQPLTVEFHETIPPSKTGKRRPIVLEQNEGATEP